MQPFDDMTPEEMDSRNAMAITFLHHVNGQGKSSFETLPIESQRTTETQVVANVRQRLLMLEKEQLRGSHMPQLALVVQKTQPGSPGSTTMSTAGMPAFRKRRNWQNRIGLLVAVAMLLLLVTSSVFVFKTVQESRTGQSSTSNTRTGASATHTATPLSLKQQAHKLVQQFHNEAVAWGNAHLYHDGYDGHNYAFNVAYLQTGLGAILDEQLAGARTNADFEAVIHAANNALFDLHMLEADYNDHTPYNVVHATDMQMIQHYHLQGQTVVISLVEQTMRVYQNGQLLRAFFITSGRQELPSTPGIWQELYRLSPTTLVSAFPVNSPYWFPKTRVNYAILYQTAGHLIVDSSWRGTYGPGTEFPHRDAKGSALASNGTEGGIDMAEQDAAWLYSNTSLKSNIVIY
jgi:lipoprotein-anchoring transpeptidase ErfK/SrfK